MTDKEFRSFLNLMMVSDPWPLDEDEVEKVILTKFANDQARIRGYRDWIEAFHRFEGGL